MELHVFSFIVMDIILAVVIVGVAELPYRKLRSLTAVLEELVDNSFTDIPRYNEVLQSRAYRFFTSRVGSACGPIIYAVLCGTMIGALLNQIVLVSLTIDLHILLSGIVMICFLYRAEYEQGNFWSVYRSTPDGRPLYENLNPLEHRDVPSESEGSLQEEI
ncbi:MAG: hypothetical protein K9W43_04830 [Candidatus Thorarchaeota archaeon]|nr:hypothetical protein [Candidatus Thorarchaeota archaeon]